MIVGQSDGSLGKRIKQKSGYQPVFWMSNVLNYTLATDSVGNVVNNDLRSESMVIVIALFAILKYHI